MDQGKYDELMADYYLCEVLRYVEVSDGIYNYNYNYSVIITKPQADSTDDQMSAREPILLQNVPRNAILFVDAPYSSDMFLAGAFRHSIGIPDEIFPSAWRNIPAQPGYP
jgi:hypothetical protein